MGEPITLPLYMRLGTGRDFLLGHVIGSTVREVETHMAQLLRDAADTIDGHHCGEGGSVAPAPSTPAPDPTTGEPRPTAQKGAQG